MLVWCALCLVAQAVLSRAELLLSSGSSGKPALDVVVTAMGAAVDAWSRLEAEETEKRRKEAEIIKYKMQEHVVRPGICGYCASGASHVFCRSGVSLFPLLTDRAPLLQDQCIVEAGDASAFFFALCTIVYEVM